MALLFCAAILACNNTSQDNAGTAEQMMTGSDAELAIIMRQIHEDAKSLKEQIIKSQYIGDEIPEYLQEIIAAETTDSLVEGPVFEAFAQTYINNIQAIYKDTSGSQKDLFNDAIATCIDCHGEFCPGPVKTIKKLYIK